MSRFAEVYMAPAVSTFTRSLIANQRIREGLPVCSVQSLRAGSQN